MSGRGVICAGHVNWDVTLYVDTLPETDGEAVVLDQTQAGGGSASNTATVLASLGREATLLGSIGDDEYGSLAQQGLSDAGVDCEILIRVSGATTVKHLVVDEEGQVMVLANDGVNEAFTAADLDDGTLGDAARLHLTSQDPETAKTLAKRAVEAGVPVSFDPGRRVDRRDYGPVVELADVVFLNESEATVARERGLLDGCDGLAVVKRGEGGAEAWTDDGRVAHSGFEVDPVDTTGAGDAFAAGFLAIRLDNGTVEQALAVGNACGALAAQSSGAQTSISWADVADYCETDVLPL